MDRYGMALARHERARQRVDDLGNRIGLALGRCSIERAYAKADLPGEYRDLLVDRNTGRIKNHLWMAYNSQNHYGELLDEQGMRESLYPSNGGCRHCMAAFRLVLLRKDARKELGYARLAIRALGKQAMKEMD